MEKKQYDIHDATIDRIEGNTIILHDDDIPGPKVLKMVKIVTSSGKIRSYTIRKTTKRGYLFN